MGIISRGLAAGASAAADLLAKDYERGQEVSAKKDLADYEANIKQRLQDAVNQFTLQLEDVKKQHQSELLQQRNEFEKELLERKLEQEGQFHQDTMELKKKELQLAGEKLGIERSHVDAILKHYTSLANTPIVQGDDGRSYYRDHNGNLVPVHDLAGLEVKISSPKDFEKYGNFIKILVDSQVITPQQGKDMMARFLTGGDPGNVRTPEEAGSSGAGVRKGGLLDAARRNRAQNGSVSPEVSPYMYP
jgi:hypothetical protein